MGPPWCQVISDRRLGKLPTRWANQVSGAVGSPDQVTGLPNRIRGNRERVGGGGFGCPSSSDSTGRRRVDAPSGPCGAEPGYHRHFEIRRAGEILFRRLGKIDPLSLTDLHDPIGLCLAFEITAN